MRLTKKAIGRAVVVGEALGMDKAAIFAALVGVQPTVNRAEKAKTRAELRVMVPAELVSAIIKDAQNPTGPEKVAKSGKHYREMRGGFIAFRALKVWEAEAKKTGRPLAEVAKAEPGTLASWQQLYSMTM